VARSLREAYPRASLIGVDYSNRCSGIHWKDFDELWLQRPWEELDLPTYAGEIKKNLDDGAWWISGNDLENIWLGHVFPQGHPHLLAPPPQAILQTVKPEIHAHAGLPVKVPPYIWTEASDWELHAFCRKHDWNVWLKGPYHEATRVKNWAEFQDARKTFTRMWSTERLFLQAHAMGCEESLCFTAYRGELLECVRMRKQEITEENKAWGGSVCDVGQELLQLLRNVVRRLHWTGGTELDLVRAADGEMWVLEWNPRFPAWIHGATLAGRNLPGQLLEAASGIAAKRAPRLSPAFTRVVLEVPVRPQFPLPPPPEPLASDDGQSRKHPSGIPKLAERLRKMNLLPQGGNGDENTMVKSAPTVPASFIEDLGRFDFTNMDTPEWLFLENTAVHVFDRASEIVDKLSASGLKIRNAYSIKTNPDRRLMELARQAGFLTEAISLLEVDKALEIGFEPQQIILNGPGKWWPSGQRSTITLHALFCDSLADLHRATVAIRAGELHTDILGVRLRSPHIKSRFGIPIDTADNFKELTGGIRPLPNSCAFGVHFHMASSNIGVGQWRHLYEAMLQWCRSLEALTGRNVHCLDMGGGWFPEDWHAESEDVLRAAIARAQRMLPHLEEMISEPGKAVAQPTMAIATRVLEIRKARDEFTEAVVDCSIAELPMHSFQPHRILRHEPRTKRWKTLSRGKTKLLGRLCMEHDILAEDVALPEDTSAGDILVFCDSGAYDRSMSYEFGRGDDKTIKRS
jgi:diaminopimelate decarboxylase